MHLNELQDNRVKVSLIARCTRGEFRSLFCSQATLNLKKTNREIFPVIKTADLIMVLRTLLVALAVVAIFSTAHAGGSCLSDGDDPTDVNKCEREWQKALRADKINFQQDYEIRRISDLMIRIPNTVLDQFNGNLRYKWMGLPGSPFPPALVPLPALLPPVCINISYFQESVVATMIAELTPIMTPVFNYSEFGFQFGQGQGVSGVFNPAYTLFSAIGLSGLDTPFVNWPVRGTRLSVNGTREYIASRLAYQIPIDKIYKQVHTIGGTVVTQDASDFDLYRVKMDVVTSVILPQPLCKLTCNCYPDSWEALRVSQIYGTRFHTIVRDRSSNPVKFYVSKQEGYAHFSVYQPGPLNGGAFYLPINGTNTIVNYEVSNISSGVRRPLE